MKAVFQSLTARLILLMVVLVTVTVVVIGSTTLLVFGSRIQEMAVQRLEALANTEKDAILNQLLNYFDETQHLVNIISEKDMVQGLIQQPEDAAMRSAALALINPELEARKGLLHVDILNSNWQILLSTRPASNQQKNLSPMSGSQLIDIEISPTYWENEQLTFDIGSPLYDKNHHLIGYLLLHYSADAILRITSNHAGFENTGETLLGLQKNGIITFLTPLRFNPNFTTLELVSINETQALPMIKATGGESGTLWGLDYRSEPVVAAYRYIDLTHWGLVVKQDQVEVNSAASKAQMIILITSLLVIFIIIGISIPVLYGALRPLHVLETATQAVTRGDLTIQVSVTGPQEIHNLAVSFNHMVAHLKDTVDDLQQRNDELNTFAYVISHDLKAPLRGINSLSEWIEEDLQGKLGEEQVKQMQLLRERVQRMDTLINALMEYSRIGRTPGNSEAVQLESLLAKIMKSLGVPDGFEVHLPPHLPTIQADRQRIQMVFQNLLENAFKHHPGPAGKVEVTFTEKEDFYTFSIRDDGNGIEPRHHKRIFEIFQTLPSASQEQGIGVGLAMATKIVEDEGGKIWVESSGQPGEGAVFHFTWPKNA